jgi:hypothetical protein
VQLDPGTIDGVHVSGAYLVALAGPEILCTGDFYNSHGRTTDQDAVQHWNAIVRQVAPSLQIRTSDAALAIGRIAFGFATGTSDSTAHLRSLEARLAKGIWTVAGYVEWGPRRDFQVRLRSDGQLESFKFDYPY